MSYPSQPFSVQLSCYLGLMCSSCSCSKFRHLLPAPMDCMVGDDCHVRLCSSAEYGIGDSHPFILASPRCFAEDNRPLRHGSSFNKQKLWGGMIAIYIAHIFFAFIASIAIIFTFHGFVDLSSQVLFTGHFISSAFCVFVSGWIKNICFICVFAASASATSRVQLLHYCSKPRYTPQKITTRTTARKCGIGMVSKLWLHFFFCN